jgi:hypothetical protein
LIVLSSRHATAAPNDAAAQRLRDLAIDQDYLATDFAAAERKLAVAVDLCKNAADCSSSMRARLHCDLGVIEYMLHRADLARSEFATALKEDPSVDVDKDLSTTDVQREFASVKRRWLAQPGEPGTSAGAAPPLPFEGTPRRGSGITHMAPGRQQVNTPLPVYVEVRPDAGASKIFVRYKPVGATDWKAAVMLKMWHGFGAEIPCSDIGSDEGKLDYYVQALDRNGDVVASSGASAAPHRVTIVRRLDGEPPHFPRRAPPHACGPGGVPAEAASVATTGDCPPGSPGCHANESPTCESADECIDGQQCVDHSCRRVIDESKLPPNKDWFSLALQGELLLLPGSNDACLGDTGYACFRSDSGAYYPGPTVKGKDDQVIGGLATSPMLRILLGYDRVVGPNVTFGWRLGYAVGGGAPRRPAGPSFVPLHIEGRLAYWFGDGVFSRIGLRFYVVVAAGVTEVDASQKIDLFPADRAQPTFVDAWRKAGAGFGAVGLGLMIAVSRSSGFLIEAKAMELFPTSGTALGAQLGYTVGL